MGLPTTYARQMKPISKRRARERITDAANEGLDLAALWDAATDAIVEAVPQYRWPCFFTLDPATVIATSHRAKHIPVLPSEWLAAEHFADDPLKITAVARSERGILTLEEATGGDLERSPKYRLGLAEYGAEQAVVVGLRTREGEVWGALQVFREPGQPTFSAEELEFLRSISVPLAEGAKRALLIGEAQDPDEPAAPGLVIVREDWSVESVTPTVEPWLDELPGGEWTARNELPSAVQSVAGRALRAATLGDAPGEIAFARVLSASGNWVMLHGAALRAAGPKRVAVIVEPAHPARIVPLLMAAYGLTEREQEVTQLVLQGESTSEIAERLVVSPHTIQQHLKGIFERTGVRSRRELVGKIFFSHYEPRVRDNERRASEGKPLRGGPVAGGETSRSEPGRQKSQRADPVA